MRIFGTVILDQDAFRALASQVRIKILKSLDERQMTVSDLSKKLSLSKSTVHKHLDTLSGAGLVTKSDDERKWVYYKITSKGRKILHPENVKISVILSSIVFGVGILLIGLAVYMVWLPLPSISGEEIQAQLVAVISGSALTYMGYHLFKRIFQNR